MKVLFVNTSENVGGAAIAAVRLMNALNREGVEVRMVVRKGKWHFLWERFVIFVHNGFSRKGLFWFDIANTGFDITALPEFQEADVIHLHWVNQGFLSLKVLNKILRSGKRVVWTMHDMWPVTGICHHSDDCEKFQTHCQHCFLLNGGGSDKDLSSRVFGQKQKIYANGRISFVACSHWLEQRAVKSALTQGHRVLSIPNPADVVTFRKQPSDHRAEFGLPAERQLILFGALRVTDKRKGIDYLVEACRILRTQHPELNDRIGIVAVGKESEALKPLFDYPVFSVDYISDASRMADLYNSVDAFVTSSLQENLPNTIMEAMGCGTPCVGFHVGGIPEMIEHQKTGYVARYKDAQDFADGICYVLDEARHDAMSEACLTKVAECYDPAVVAQKYMKVYGE